MSYTGHAGWCVHTCRSRSGSLPELQQQPVPDPAELVQGAEEAAEGQRPAARQDVQQLQGLLPAARLGLDLLHLGHRQDALLVQERNDRVGHQQLPGQL